MSGGSTSRQVALALLPGVRKIVGFTTLGAAVGVSSSFEDASLLAGFHSRYIFIGVGIGLAAGSLLAYGQIRIALRDALGGRRAEVEFAALAEERGWTYLRQAPADGSTALLRAGDRQVAGRGFELTISGLACRLFQQTRIVGKGRNEQRKELVVLLTQVRLPGIPLLQLHARAERPLSETVAALALGLRSVELESTELSQRFALQVPSDADDVTVRRLFDPLLIGALLDLASGKGYLGEDLEVERGALVLASGGTLSAGDGPAIDATVAAAAPVLERFRAFAESSRPSPMPIHPV